MTNEELATMMEKGFDGVNSRLDELNGRTRKNENGLAVVVAQTTQLENHSYDREARLRNLENHSAVADSQLKDLRELSRREGSRSGFKWGALASAAVSVIVQVITHFVK